MPRASAGAPANGAAAAAPAEGAGAAVPQGCRPDFNFAGGAQAVWPVSIMGDVSARAGAMRSCAAATTRARRARCPEPPCLQQPTPGPDASPARPSRATPQLHLEPAQMHLFGDAQQHLRAAMSDAAGRLLPGARVVQVGDLGGYKHGPGTRACFEGALEYMEGFGAPFSLITGNHGAGGAQAQAAACARSVRRAAGGCEEAMPMRQRHA
jgi:hypothetical protein